MTEQTVYRDWMLRKQAGQANLANPKFDNIKRASYHVDASMLGHLFSPFNLKVVVSDYPTPSIPDARCHTLMLALEALAISLAMIRCTRSPIGGPSI